MYAHSKTPRNDLARDLLEIGCIDSPTDYRKVADALEGGSSWNDIFDMQELENWPEAYEFLQVVSAMDPSDSSQQGAGPWYPLNDLDDLNGLKGLIAKAKTARHARIEATLSVAN